MTQITIDTRQIDDFLKKFGVEAIPVVENRMRIALDESLEYLLGLVVDNTPVNYGTLRGSEYTEVRGVSADATRGVQLEGLVSSSDFEPKVWAMEHGRSIGKEPPIEAIALWVKRKGLILTPFRHRDGSMASEDEMILKLAKAIAKLIAEGKSRHQKNPFKMFQTAFEQGGKQVEKNFDQAVDDILNGWAAI